MSDHIVINVETGKYECQHCKATQSPPPYDEHADVLERLLDYLKH